jgi:O-antigen/teichoic acid export membrane protein
MLARNNFFFKMVYESDLIKHFGVYSVGKFLGILSSFALLPLFTKKIPPEQFGIIGLLWVVGPIFSRIITLGADAALLLKIYKLEKEQFSNYLYHTLVIIILCSLSIWVFFLLNFYLVNELFEDSMTKLDFSLFLLSVTSLIIILLWTSILQFWQKVYSNIVISTFQPILISVLSFYLIINVQATYKMYIVGMVIGNTIFGIVALMYFFKNFSINNFKLSSKIFYDLMKIGIPIIPSTFSYLIMVAGDRFIIKYYLGLDSVAVYTFGARLSEYIVFSIFQPFQKANTPIVRKKVAKSIKEAKEYTKALTNIFNIFITILLCLLVIPAKDFIHLISDDIYGSAYPVFIFTIIGFYFDSIWRINGQLINHLEKTKLTMVLAVFGAITNIALNLYFIPIYGVIAASVTTAVTFFLVYISSIFFLKRFIEFDISIYYSLTKVLPLITFLMIVFILDMELIFGYIANQLIYIFKVISFIMLILYYFIFEEKPFFNIGKFRSLE